mgnify:CR=1 FL=1
MKFHEISTPSAGFHEIADLHTPFHTPVKNVSDHDVSNMRFITYFGLLVFVARVRGAFQTVVQRAGQQEPGRRFGVFLPSAMHSGTSKGFTFCSQGFLTSLPPAMLVELLGS